MPAPRLDRAKHSGYCCADISKLRENSCMHRWKPAITRALSYSVYLLLIISVRVSGASGESASQQAAALLAASDSSGALSFLENTLDNGSKDYAAFLLRGRLRLTKGDYRQAEIDFRRVLFSESDSLHSEAHLGLGDLLRSQRYRNWDAVGEYRLALSADSTCLAAWYAIAQTAFELGWTDGYMTADEALAKLICLDPEYRDALSQWWDRIFIQSDDELRRVCGCLRNYLASHPDRCMLRLYVAKILFRVGEHSEAVAALDSLDTACPDFKLVERSLLRANCLLALGDTLGFETGYAQAIDRAEQENDFTPLLQEAEPIFSPEDATGWAASDTPGLRAAFFRAFWLRRDPDPFSPRNERLVTHYQRLHKARKYYYHLTPHSFTETSRNYNNLTAARPVYSDTSRHYDFKYTPALWWDRCRQLALQQRGLFFIRHGEPDFLYKSGLPWEEGEQSSLYDITVRNGGSESLRQEQSGPPRVTGGLNGVFDGRLTPQDEVSHYGAPKRDYRPEILKGEPYEAWRYGPAYFLFDKYSGKYSPRPVVYGDAGDIIRAMQSESFRDPLPAFRPDIFAVDFRADSGRVELLFFQSAPQDSVAQPNAPFSDLALYDSTWSLVARDSSIAWPVESVSGSLWLAANRAVVPPGQYNFVHRLDVPNRRAVLKKQAVSLPPYPQKNLHLSGILLGAHPERGNSLFSRHGAEINPRPGARFAAGERISIYLEVYNLVRSNSGGQAFQERVTVSRDEKKSPLAKLLPMAFQKRKKSLSMAFERAPEITSSRIAETFDLDTAPLMPGIYSLKVEVRDRKSGSRYGRSCSFEIIDQR